MILLALAEAARSTGDRVLREDPERAGALYLRCAELTLAAAFLERARALSRVRPLRALEFLRRCEALQAPLDLCRQVAARTYLALGEAEVARAFYAACGAPAPRRAARPWRTPGRSPSYSALSRGGPL